MNLFLIHQAFVTPDEPGGTRHFELARRLVDLGHQFTIVASDLNYLTGRPAIEGKKLISKHDVKGIEILRAYTLPRFGASFLSRIASFISFMMTSTLASFKVKKVDVVMGTSPPIFQAVSAWFVAFLRRKPFLLEIRDLWPEFAIDIGILKNRLAIWLSRRLERFLYQRADHIVVNSPAYKDYLIKMAIPEKKVTLISNGVDADMFDPLERGNGFREKFNLNGHFVVTYAGALGLANNVATVVEAAALLRDEPHIHFLVVGDGSERARLKQKAKQLNLTNLTLTGSLPKSQMREVLSASDACVATLKNIPMFRTTYPNKVFDYMAAGRAVVLAIDGAIRAVIEDAGCGVFVQPGSEAALAEAIVKLSKDRSQTKAMGVAGRKYVSRHFSRDRQARDLLRLFHRLAVPASTGGIDVCTETPVSG